MKWLLSPCGGSDGGLGELGWTHNVVSGLKPTYLYLYKALPNSFQLQFPWNGSSKWEKAVQKCISLTKSHIADLTFGTSCRREWMVWRWCSERHVDVKGLTPKRRAKEKFHYPTAGLFSASLKMKIKIFFLLEIVRNDVKKHKMQLFPFRFHLTWTRNPLKIGSA